MIRGQLQSQAYTYTMKSVAYKRWIHFDYDRHALSEQSQELARIIHNQSEVIDTTYEETGNDKVSAL